MDASREAVEIHIQAFSLRLAPLVILLTPHK